MNTNDHLQNFILKMLYVRCNEYATYTISLVFSYKRLCQCSVLMKSQFSSQAVLLHERTKHTKINYKLVHDRVLAGLTNTPHIDTSGQIIEHAIIRLCFSQSRLI